VTRLELAAAAAATVVTAPCGRTVVAGVAALPCAMVVVVAVHVVSSEKKVSSIKRKEKEKKNVPGLEPLLLLLPLCRRTVVVVDWTPLTHVATRR
jgi:hypothetical protein